MTSPSHSGKPHSASAWLAARVKGRNSSRRSRASPSSAGREHQGVVLVGGQRLLQSPFRTKPEPAPARRRQAEAVGEQRQYPFRHRVVEARQRRRGKSRASPLAVKRGGQRSRLAGTGDEFGDACRAVDAGGTGGNGRRLRQYLARLHGLSGVST
jgi:hypothetical protein